jgi:hypothetical protein
MVIKNMNKIILTIGVASSLIVTPAKKDGTIVNSIEQNEYLLSEALGNIQDVREWIEWDVFNEKLDPNQANTYLEHINQAEDLIIEFETNSVQTKYNR